MEGFAAAKRQFRLHMRPDEVLAEARWSDGAPKLEEVQTALAQLAEWGNLEAQPDTARVASISDFYRARFLYRLSHGGEAVETALAAFAEALGRRAELQTVALEDIANRLKTLLALADAPTPDAAKLHETKPLPASTMLPAAGIPRAQLAVATLGDAHALDAGSPVAALVLSALRHGAAPDDDADRARDLWAAAGVLVNELARPALTLTLPGLTGTEPGEPAYFSLRRLLRSPPPWAVVGRPVFVCENPNLLAIAADQLGPNCAPLVCTDGMPAAAQRVLLTQLRVAGAALHYHGDFDWPGLRIGNQMIREHDTRPWRFSTADYRAAVIGAPRPGRPLDDAAISALWDDTLACAMLAERLAIDEEGLADVLLDDLRQ